MNKAEYLERVAKTKVTGDMTVTEARRARVLERNLHLWWKNRAIAMVKREYGVDLNAEKTDRAILDGSITSFTDLRPTGSVRIIQGRDWRQDSHGAIRNRPSREYQLKKSDLLSK